MAIDHSVEICRKLSDKFNALGLRRGQSISCYDAGDELCYEVTAIENSSRAKVSLVVEKFVGGGFAGQVYRVKVTGIEGGDVDGLEVGAICAIKILIPPSGFSRFFRNVLYWIGFQGPFQLQVNPAAARAGAMWQKFIRRAGKIRFGSERSVVNIHATFVDETLGSCGEISEWVQGRTWRLEVDEHLDTLKRWSKGKDVDADRLGSPEYRAKREFMSDFVDLLHEMGAYEFARQYEWSTCKSQPNCLKRLDGDEGVLTAVDFRAGLALLPILPMSPGDFKLIWRGLKRGSIVQFDRGNIEKLEKYIANHYDEFADMQPMVEKLKDAEKIYRNSIPDITHNHFRLLYSGRLWTTIFENAVTGWRVRNLVEEKTEQKLRGNRFMLLVFLFTGIIPFLGQVLRKYWGRENWRKHYRSILTSKKYFLLAVRGKIIEKVLRWHRGGRVDQDRAEKLSEPSWLFLLHLPLSILPAGLHRILTDLEYAKERLAYFTVRPVRLYFNRDLRQQWLFDMVSEGKKKHILGDEDADVILSHIKEPFIQKYLKSLAVHVCTLPVTQIVSGIIALIYWIRHPEMPKAERGLAVGAILILFQIMPISPGSICRGTYTLYMAIKDRSFKDYNIAVFLSFFKYVGYLAFPIQMAYHYPALARFMAAHWATEVVHIVPVFGERGALLEHWVYCAFYNWPLTIRRRMRRIVEVRSSLKPKYSHIDWYVFAATLVFGVVDFIYLQNTGRLPGLRAIWVFSVFVPLICGARISLGCGGAELWRRIVAATVCGTAMGLLYSVVSTVLAYTNRIEIAVGSVVIGCLWRVFLFSVLSTIGGIFAELKQQDPDLLE